MKIASLVAMLCLAVAVSGCGSSETDRALASYDPQEVQLLREQARSNKIELTDELLLGTLQARDDCRVLRAAVDDYRRGDTEAALQRMRDLPSRVRDRGQADQATYFQSLHDQLAAGDPANAQDYLVKNCQGVR